MIIRDRLTLPDVRPYGWVAQIRVGGWLFHGVGQSHHEAIEDLLGICRGLLRDHKRNVEAAKAIDLIDQQRAAALQTAPR